MDFKTREQAVVSRMSFEEQFPSLVNNEDCYWVKTDSDGNTTICYLNYTEFGKQWFSQSYIEHHCLDKERVKEAINKCTRTGAPLIDKEELLKELGLEDEE